MNLYNERDRKPLDQARRQTLCRAILAGEAGAVEGLALLYEECGNVALARAVRLAGDGARHHAYACLGEGA